MSAPPMRVVINDRPLRKPRTGVGQYVYQLLQALPAVAPQHRFVPFHFTYVARRPPDPQGPLPAPGGPIQGSRKPWFVRRLLQGSYEVLFNAVTAVARFDLYHEPNHIPMRWSGPTITTVHDLSALRFPHWHPADRVRWYEAEFERSLWQTDHFIAASWFTKSEMIRLLGVSPLRITVSYQAPRWQFWPRPPQACRQVLSALGIEPPYLLFVGTLEPRKNLPRVVEAYGLLPPRLRRRFRLVIVGGLGWSFDELLRSLHLAQAGESIRVTGFLDDERLACLYSACHALIWPSLYEGFGLPPLECMACGRPAVVSNAGSLPEVVAGAALKVDPQDVEAIASAMRWIMEDGALWVRLAERGLRRAGEFSWQRCAGEHLAVYERFRAG